jgi:hypothetical protein
MRQPLLFDFLDVLLPLAVGAIAFLLGRSLRRWPGALRIGIVALAMALVSAGALALSGFLPAAAGPMLSRLGGATVLLSWTALLLLGVVWSAPGRSFSSGFLAALAGLAGCLILIETSGRLWWRFGDPQSWQRVADADGRLRQSNGLTCSPTAAVMLLHRHGISASEGEMAYLAGTSLFGTDALDIVRALQLKVEPRGWRAQVRYVDFDTCAREEGPFVAHVGGPSLGHALLVERVTGDRVEFVDPLDGERRTLARLEFERIWDGTMIRVVRDDGN